MRLGSSESPWAEVSLGRGTTRGHGRGQEHCPGPRAEVEISWLLPPSGLLISFSTSSDHSDSSHMTQEVRELKPAKVSVPTPSPMQSRAESGEGRPEEGPVGLGPIVLFL